MAILTNDNKEVRVSRIHIKLFLGDRWAKIGSLLKIGFWALVLCWLIMPIQKTWAQTPTTPTPTSPPTPILENISLAHDPFNSNSTIQKVILTFNVPMDNAILPNVILSGPATWTLEGGRGVWSTINNTQSTFTLTYTHDGSEQEETVTASVDNLADLRDTQGMGIDVAQSQQSVDFTVDAKAPTVTDIELNTGLVINDTAIVSSANSDLTIEIEYSEKMDPAFAPGFTFNPMSSFRFSSGKWSADSTKYTATYRHQNSSPITVSAVNITNNSQARDLNGNAAQQTSTPAIFSIDASPPIITLSYVDTDAKTSNGNTFVINAAISEPIKDSNPLMITITYEGQNVVETAAMTKVNETLYTYSYNVNVANNTEGDANITLTGGEDISGNGAIQDTNSPSTFYINNTPLTATFSPADFSLNVPISDQFPLKISFDRKVNFNGNVRFTIYEEVGTNHRERQNITYNTLSAPQDNVILFYTDGLERGKKYYVSIPQGAFVDEAGVQFGGIDGSHTSAALTPGWRFTTFAEPTIKNISFKGTAQALCIEDTITIEGNFLTGVSRVEFGAGNSPISVSGNRLLLQSDSVLFVVVPSNAKEGKIKVIKEANMGNPEVSATHTTNYQVGPRSAILASAGSGTTLPVYVCNVGNTTSAPMKATINGGLEDYTVVYRTEVDGIGNDQTASTYKSGEDININPQTNEKLHTVTLVSVTDKNNCPVPQSGLSGVFSVYKNVVANVYAGGSNDANKEAQICLGNTQDSIQLDNISLVGAPTLSGGASNTSVVWTTQGEGYFKTGTDSTLTPTYFFAVNDYLKREVGFTLTSTNNPQACAASSDNVTLKFTGSPSAEAGGDANGFIYFCQNQSSGDVQIALLGTVRNATGFEWASTGSSPGTFSDPNVASPIYTMSDSEIAAGQAELTLTATGATCNGSGSATSVPDRVTVRLISKAAPTIQSPRVDVCTGESVFYSIQSPSASSSFKWEIEGGVGEFENGQTTYSGLPSVKVNWSAITPGQGDLKVTEIDEKGCAGNPSEASITVHSNANPGVKEPSSVLSFPTSSSDVALIGNLTREDSLEDNTMEFLGDGVFTLEEGTGASKFTNYYFSPSVFWAARKQNPANAGNPQESVEIRYRYKVAAANCTSAEATITLNVYNERQAFVIAPLNAIPGTPALALGNDNRYRICADQPVRISISQAFLAANKISQDMVFKNFTIEGQVNSSTSIDLTNSAFVNIQGTRPQRGDSYAILYPSRLRTAKKNSDGSIEYISFSFPEEIIITGWLYNPQKSNEAPTEYGKVSIIINPLPSLSFNPIAPTMCVDATSVALTKDNVKNPDESYSFFTKNSSYSAAITGNSITGYLLKGDTLFAQNTANDIYPPPIDLEIGYTYQNTQGCKDTTTFEVQLLKRPLAPQLKDIKRLPAQPGYIVCINQGNIPPVSVSNQAFFRTIPQGDGNPETILSTIKWYRSINFDRDDSKISEGFEFTPTDIDVNSNEKKSYYITQDISGCVSPYSVITYEVLNLPPVLSNKSCVDGKKTTFSLPIRDIQNGNVNIQSSATVWSLKSDPDAGNIPGSSFTASNGNLQFEYTFKTPGIDTISVTVESASGCVNNRSERVVMLNQTALGPNNLYSESFDNNDGKFVAVSDPTSPINTWQHGLLTNKTVKPISRDETPVWVTGLNGPYGNGERSYLYLGCIDISAIQSPIIGFDTWINTDGANDGAVLQYSTDGKVLEDPNKVWKAVGTVGSGLGWYNRQLIQSIPNNAINNYGWSSSEEDWIASRHSLQQVKNEQQSANNIPVFRFVFASTKTQAGKVGVGGLALDNLYIAEQGRIVLMENFTNKSNMNKRQAEEIQSRVFKRVRSQGVGKQVVKINYHVGFPTQDPFNIDDPLGPSARALFYGIQEAPTIVINGKQAPSDVIGNERQLESWITQETDINVLEPNDVKIEIDTNPLADVENGGIGITVRVTPQTQDTPKEAKLYIVVLEDIVQIQDLPDNKQSLISTNEPDFEYIAKEILPSPAGKSNGFMEKGKTYTFGPYYWYPKPEELYGDDKDVAVAAFLQNEATSVVYQSSLVENVTIPSVITSVEESHPFAEMQVYPNPADSYTTVVFPYPTQLDTHISLISTAGKAVKQATILHGETTRQIHTKELPNGIYILKIQPEKQPPIYRKIAVEHGR